MSMDMRQKLDRHEIDNIMMGKIDTNTVAQHIDHLVTKDDFLDLKQAMMQVNNETQNTRGEYRALSKIVEDNRKQLTVKANIQDICSLIDMKANIEDVNQIFRDINKELDIKADLADFKTFSKE